MASAHTNEFDLLLKHIQEHGLPPCEDWLWLCLLGEELTGKAEAVALKDIIKRVADRVGGPKAAHNASRKLRSLSKQLNRQIVQGLPGEGSELTPGGKTLINQLKNVLRDVQRALFPCEFPFVMRVVARHEINTRKLPQLLEGVRQDLRKEDELKAERAQADNDQDLVDFDIDYDSSHRLLDRGLDGDDDLVMLFCSKAYRFTKGVEVAYTDMPRCLLLPNNDPLTGDIEKKGFSWNKLVGRRIFLPEDSLALPDFPMHELDAIHTPVRRVTTFPQAHAFVASKSGLTISHPDLLREHEEQQNDAIVIDEFGTTRLSVILCPKALSRRSPGQKKVVRKVFESIKRQLQPEAPTSGSRQPAEVAAKIRDFQYAWHTTLDGEAECYWSDRGTISLRYTPSGYVKGLHSPGSPCPQYNIFGRMIETPGNVRQYQILWDGTHERDDLYSVSFIFDGEQLDKGVLVGTWVGQASLLTLLEKRLRPGTGLMVIAKDNISSSANLDKLIKNNAKHLLAWKPPRGFIRDA